MQITQKELERSIKYNHEQQIQIGILQKRKCSGNKHMKEYPNSSVSRKYMLNTISDNNVHLSEWQKLIKLMSSDAKNF